MSATALEREYTNNALTVLSEEEELFRSSVREFAEGEVRPRVERMEHESKLDKDLIKQCFELGLMAIETPEEYGGAGSSFFNAIPKTVSTAPKIFRRLIFFIFLEF